MDDHPFFTMCPADQAEYFDWVLSLIMDNQLPEMTDYEIVDKSYRMHLCDMRH
jgi:hypothetical protein